jgi:hypothetical protein
MPTALTVLLLVMLCANAAAGQRTNPSPAPAPATRAERLDRWLMAVAQHQPGTLDRVAIEIGSWPDDQIGEVISDVRELALFLVRAHARFARTGQPSAPAHHHGRTYLPDELQRLFGLTTDEAARGDVSRLALGAVLFHTDISIMLDEYEPVIAARGRPSEPRAVLVADGRSQGVADRGPHWRLARSLLDLVPADGPRVTRKRDWYVAAAAFMHSRGRLADMLPQTVRATELFPEDPDVLAGAGIVHETLASPSIQVAVRGLSPPGQVRFAVDSAGAHLRRARTFFERALLVAPGHAEARVRLGHVLGALGEPDRAVAVLQPVSSAEDPTLRYYAALFLGGFHARAGRADEARAAYERAASLFPRAQSPRLGLSSLARAAGDRAAAVRTLTDGLPTRHSNELRDPWWLYFAIATDRADSLLAAWRGSVEPWNAK